MAAQLKRDLSSAQFWAACNREGFKPQGFMGYFSLPGTAACVSICNAGRRRRDQLNYLRRELQAMLRKDAADEAAALAMRYHPVVHA
jgi:hypothetical protein